MTLVGQGIINGERGAIGCTSLPRGVCLQEWQICCTYVVPIKEKALVNTRLTRAFSGPGGIRTCDLSRVRRAL